LQEQPHAVGWPGIVPGAIASLAVPSVTTDQVRNLTDLRGLVHKLGGSGVTREELVARLRNNADALTLTARLRRSGMSDAAITAAMFEGATHDV
jgi:hypothetical protein